MTLDVLGFASWMCPSCSWSLSAEGAEGFDFAGVEAALKDHLDEDHPGWTFDRIREAMAVPRQDA